MNSSDSKTDFFVQFLLFSLESFSKEDTNSSHEKHFDY